MHELPTPSLIRLLCVGALLLGLSGVAQAKDIKNEDLSAEHADLATQIGDVPTDVEMSAQHDMIKQDIADAETAIQADIAEVKALVEALDVGGGAGPLCGAGTAGQRFVLSEDGTEVCDNNTGLYWEQSPSTFSSLTQRSGLLMNAKDYCTGLDLGNGQVYRLAEVKELISLVDYSKVDQATALNTPNGPFEDVRSAGYWSASSRADGPTLAWFVDFSFGSMSFTNSSDLFHAWCVRGGS